MVIQEDEFKKFAEYIKTNYGIHFKEEKKVLIEGRLGQVLANMHIATLSDYMEYVKADQTGHAASVMLDKITTNYTFFMREPEHFRFFKTIVLPYLEKSVPSKDLRIWSAACSTGEEPYTLAMIIDEFFGMKKAGWDTKILATDISKGVLEVAKAGLYTADQIVDLPLVWKQSYFKRFNEEQYAIADRIKKEVIFGSVNLMSQTLPFKKKMHVIFCRNVMIYFDNETKERLVRRLYDITEPGGFLFIGHAEGLNRETMRYRYVMPAVYRKE